MPEGNPRDRSVYGKPGNGKDIRAAALFEEDEPEPVQCAYLCLSTVSVQEFYRQLCEALGLESGFGKCQMFKFIQERLYYLYKKRQPFICILDEAQYLNSSILRDLKMLMNQKYDSVNCFSLK
ncbi:MAG TPA: ATP-binding protein [Firmicutes bacterium]|nr:ATP-binding protein [Bacillota bacterium]